MRSALEEAVNAPGRIDEIWQEMMHALLIQVEQCPCQTEDEDGCFGLLSLEDQDALFEDDNDLSRSGFTAMLEDGRRAFEAGT
ncbi:hypothetical protein HQ524_02090 [Candidatus Uhrbacteria bacterium]|nr:hypothetical protein [Candidatus Uhrbacteria bacterium]